MTRELILAIVDDDEAILSGLSSLTRSVGYTVRLYKSAEAFLADGRLPLPSCLLTDLQMPGMNGLQLQLAVRKRTPPLPVIFMTAYPEETVRERAMLYGAFSFLEKPFEAETILQVLSAAIDTNI